MNDCCCVELTVTEDPQVTLDIQEQFIDGGGGITPTGTKEISVTQNGTTNTDVTYYANAKVVANVPNSYTASDEGKVVQDGNLESQTTATFEANDTYDTTTIKQVTVDVPASAVDSGYVYINENDTVDVVGYAQAVVNVPASAVDTGTKNITANGDNQDVVGYAAVDVNVPNSYSASDEGKVVSNGALVAQTSDTVTTNDTYDTTLINSLTVNVSGGGGADLSWIAAATPTPSVRNLFYALSQGAVEHGEFTLSSRVTSFVDLITWTGNTPQGFVFVDKEFYQGLTMSPNNSESASVLWIDKCLLNPAISPSADYVGIRVQTNQVATLVGNMAQASAIVMDGSTSTFREYWQITGKTLQIKAQYGNNDQFCAFMRNRTYIWFVY